MPLEGAREAPLSHPFPVHDKVGVCSAEGPERILLGAFRPAPATEPDVVFSAGHRELIVVRPAGQMFCAFIPPGAPIQSVDLCGNEYALVVQKAFVLLGIEPLDMHAALVHSHLVLLPSDADALLT